MLFDALVCYLPAREIRIQTLTFNKKIIDQGIERTDFPEKMGAVKIIFTISLWSSFKE
jgi:hypothetical protein